MTHNTQQVTNTTAQADTPANGSTSDWFNLHIEGCGSLYNARLVEPKPGTPQRFTPFQAVRMSLLQGPTQDPQPLFVDLKVTGTKARKIVAAYASQINTKGLSTFASVKFSDLAIEVNPQAPEGKQPFYLKGRLVAVTFLKVNGQVIDLSAFDEQPAQPSVEVQPQAVSAAQPAPVAQPQAVPVAQPAPVA